MQPVTVVLCLLVLGAHMLLVLSDCEVGGQSLKVGQTYKPPGRCIEHTCQANGSVKGKTCPSVATLKPCKLVENVNEAFPKCCPYYDCDNNLKL
ncbi:U-scoloptoxin(16)-Er8a [Drosophila novamexicana]|uniref:U-scoloptoxin(16)-Er8a n=1 Tax=Drosophila novamexicana TaxID=47314 RepID=UPI0011E603E5|nr:U-scoloptoxin(16)-Er8a [Drosophila novamexicana]